MNVELAISINGPDHLILQCAEGVKNEITLVAASPDACCLPAAQPGFAPPTIGRS